MKIVINGEVAEIPGGESLQAGDGIRIKDKTISVTLPTKSVTQAEYDELSEEQKQAEVLYLVESSIADAPGLSGLVPTGAIIPFLGLRAPAGYLICDGAEHPISQYPRLAQYFVEQFGQKNYFGGDGITTIAAPDMRNLFLRGYHGEAEEQLSGDIGAKQEGTIYPMVGNSGTSDPKGRVYWATNIKGTAITVAPQNVDSKHTNGTLYYGFSSGDTELTTSYDHADNRDAYSYTSRPVNMAVLYCIKT